RSFGGLQAVADVSFALRPGARQALIGPNGAGKTTFINLLTGVLPASAGRIRLAGAGVTGLAPHQRVRRGMVRTCRIPQRFAELTPREAIAVAIVQRDGLATVAWRSVWRHAPAIDEATALLRRLGLDDVATVPTAQIAYGKRRQLE